MGTFGRIAVAGGLLAFALCDAGGAKAAGFASARFGGEYGNPVTTNPMALYFNPAGIAFADGVDLMGVGDLAIRHASWSHDESTVIPGNSPATVAGNSGTASLLNVFGGPALGGTIKLGNLALGAGLFVPFGGRVDWGKNNQFSSSYPAGQTCSGNAGMNFAGNGACPLAMDGVQRWHIINAALTFIYFTAGAAYKLGPLSIGATGNFIDSSLTESQAKTSRGNSEDSTLETRSTLNVTGFNGSFAVGGMLEAVPNRVWLGVSYQAQPGLGPQMLKGTVDYAPGPQPYYGGGSPTHYNVDFHQSLPDIYRAGIRWRALDVLELRLFGDYTRWSVMKAQCVNQADTPMGTSCLVYQNGSTASGSATILANVPRNWNDTYGVRIGATYWVQKDLEVFGGLGFETAAAPDATLEPGAMDADNIGIAAGVRIKVTPTMYLAASYTHLQYLNRNVPNGTSTLATNGGMPVQVPTYSQDGSGQYTQWIGILDGNVEVKF